MGQYEWIFVVDSVARDVMDDIYESYDALFTEHNGKQLLTVTLTGRNATEAARAGISDLSEKHHVRVLRSYADLVTRGDIAERVNSTVQAVGQWIRGDRLRKTPFPQPENHVAGGVWLWGVVNDWLKSVSKPCETEIDYPSHSDHAAIDLWLTDQQRFHSTEPLNHEGRQASPNSTGGKRWYRAAKSSRGRVTTAQSSQRLNWTGTDYEVVG